MAEPVDTTGFYNRSVNLMQKYKNLNFVKRALNSRDPKALKYNFTLGDKLTKPFVKLGDTYGTHLMSYDPNKKLGNIAYPLIVQKPNENKLSLLSPDQAYDYATQNKQYIPLGKDKNFAEYFTTVGYKYKEPSNTYNEAMKDYVSNTNIKRIPKHQLGNALVRSSQDPVNKSQIDTNWNTVKRLYDRAKQRGLSHNQIVGLLGNIAVETGGSFSPTQRQRGGGGGYGLIQVTNPVRKRIMMRYVKDPSNLDQQFDYILNTMFDKSTDNLTNVWGGHGRQERWVKNPNLAIPDSTALLTKLYFRPGNPNIQERQKAANYISSKINLLNSPNSMIHYLPATSPITFPGLKFTNNVAHPPLLQKKGGVIAKKDPSLGTPSLLKKGGKKNWIQKAVNPKHSKPLLKKKRR